MYKTHILFHDAQACIAYFLGSERRISKDNTTRSKFNALIVSPSAPHDKSITLQDIRAEQGQRTMHSRDTRDTCVILFPDKKGSLHPGCRTMFFRDGIFAASMYSQWPIVDIVWIEPEQSADHSCKVVFSLWNPPPVQNHLEYDTMYDWYLANKTDVRKYAKACELQFKQMLDMIEYAVCTI